MAVARVPIAGRADAPAPAARGLRVLFAAAEVFPLVKTGGLADAAACLPFALRERGIDARVIVPGYRAVRAQAQPARVLSELAIPGVAAPVRVLAARLPDGVPLYVIDAPECFDRGGNPYLGPDGSDWPDNARRFAVFGRAIAALALGAPGVIWRPDVLHCNDWHSGLAPALVQGAGARPGIVFGIHNLAYQGLFPYAQFLTLDLPPALWSYEALEFHGAMSFIKGGLSFADRIVAVSPQYAREIRTAEYGCGLDGLLRHRREVLHGIVNGVDYRVWDPRRDVFIARHYWIDALDGKQADKSDLQARAGLERRADAFLVAHIGRLTAQKGTDLIAAAAPDLLRDARLQLVLLGSGERALEQALARLARRWSGRVAVCTDYDEALAHRIEAGADAFLMPSRFEPCGLNQLYSLRYGTVPIVRATGGLRDTVVDAGAGAGATGFVFERPHVSDLTAAVQRAARVFHAGDGRWRALMRAGMQQDFSWGISAQRYHALYRDLCRDRPATSPA